MSALLFAYLRFTAHPPRIQAHAGLVFMVLNAVGVGLLNTWARPLTDDALNELSWNTIVILCGAMLMPATPKQMLVAALLSATMDPLGIGAGRAARPRGAVGHAHVRAVPAQLRLRAGRRGAVDDPAPARTPPAPGPGAGELSPRRLLGRGGMGEVWLARHQLLARSAAIKLVRPEVLGAGTDAAAAVMLRRFEREAQATAALSSPHSIRLFDFGVTEDRTFYYVMELLAGRDLETLVREFGPLPADRVVYLLRQVCHSLAEAHARGPGPPRRHAVQRLSVPDGPRLRLRQGARFRPGEVQRRSGRSSTRVAGGRTATAGTPAFMAPELIAEGEVDARADVYSLGCVAYYLLTGQLVFEAERR